MANTTRTEVKRKLDYAKKDIENALNLIISSGSLYEEHHPDIFQKFCEIATALDLINKAIQGLSDSI